MDSLGSELVVPDLQKIQLVFNSATAPAFFLGAVAAFVALMNTRLGVVNERIRTVIANSENNERRERHLFYLRRRARMLHDGILLTLAAGICATLLLFELFVSHFLDFTHAYGSALLFMVATLCLAAALVRFAQEALYARSEIEHEFG